MLIAGFSLFFYPAGFIGTAAVGPRDIYNQYPRRSYPHNSAHQRFGRMASCGPPPPRAAATPAAGATAAARAAAHPVLPQYTLLKDLLRQVQWPWEEIRRICSYVVTTVGGTRSLVPGVLNLRYIYIVLYKFCL